MTEPEVGYEPEVKRGDGGPAAAAAVAWLCGLLLVAATLAPAFVHLLLMVGRWSWGLIG